MRDKSLHYAHWLIPFLPPQWKVKKTDNVLNLEGRNFLESDIELIGRTLLYTDTYMFNTIILSRQSTVLDPQLKIVMDISNMKFNFMIHTIEMVTTKIGDEGCKTLQYTLAENGTLTNLDLRDSQEITDVGAARLLSLVKYVEKPKDLGRTPYHEVLHNTPEGTTVIDNMVPSLLPVYTEALFPPLVAPKPKDTGPRLLIVRLIEAKGLVACDGGGTSDPFVKLELVDSRTGKALGESFKSSTVKKTLDPVFEEVFEFGKKVSLANPDNQPTLTLSFFDSDMFSSEDMGRATILLGNLDQSTDLVSRRAPLMQTEKSKKKITGEVAIELQYSREATGERTSSTRRLFKRSMGKMRTFKGLGQRAGTSPALKKEVSSSPTHKTPPANRGASKSWMKAKSSFQFMAGRGTKNNDTPNIRPSTLSKATGSELDLMASELASQLASKVEAADLKMKNKANILQEEVEGKKAADVLLTPPTKSGAEFESENQKEKEREKTNSVASSSARSVRNIFGLRSLGKRTLKKLKSSKGKEVKEDEEDIENSVNVSKDFPSVHLSDTTEKQLVNSFAVTLGFSDGIEGIKEEKADVEKRKRERLEKAAKPKSILKAKKTPLSGSQMRGVDEEEDVSKKTDLSLTLLSSAMTPSTESPLPVKSVPSSKPRSISFGSTSEAKEPGSGASLIPASALKTSMTKNLTKKKLSFGGRMEEGGTGSATKAKGISFSPSSLSQKSVDFIEEPDAADIEAEKLAAEMAKLVAGGVVGRGGRSVDTESKRSAGFSSVSLVSRATRGFKRSLLSPKRGSNAGTGSFSMGGSSPKTKEKDVARDEGHEEDGGGAKKKRDHGATWSAARTKFKATSSWVAPKSNSRKLRKTAAVGVADKVGTETLEELIAETEKVEVKEVRERGILFVFWNF